MLSAGAARRPPARATPVFLQRVQLFQQRCQLGLQRLHPGAGARQLRGLGVEFLAAHHVEASERGLQQELRVAIDLAAQPLGPDELVDLLDDLADWWWFQRHWVSPG